MKVSVLYAPRMGGSVLYYLTHPFTCERFRDRFGNLTFVWIRLALVCLYVAPND